MLISADRSPALRDSALVVAGLVGGLAVGAAYAFRTSYGIALLGLLVLVLVVAVRPVLLAVGALLGVYFVQRLGAGGATSGGISYSDVLLALASVFAFPSLVRDTALIRRLRLPLFGCGVYLACLLVTVFANPSRRAYLEWAHRVVLVGGALLVGVWLGREGVVRPALRLLVAVSCVVAGAAVVYALRNGFAPAYPFGLNKNLVGALLGAVMMVVLLAGEVLGLRRNLRVTSAVLVVAGLLASQSRGALLGAAAGLLIAFIGDTRVHSRGVRLLSGLVAIVFAIIVTLSVRDQFGQTKAEFNNTSIGTRINVERETFDIFETSEFTGVGLKYFNTGLFGPLAQPSNNAFNNELAESGVIGLLGFVVLQIMVFVACIRHRRDGSLGLAGLAVLTGAFLHGQVDIYWSASAASLPFLLIGIGLAGAQRLDRHSDDPSIGLTEQRADIVV